MNKTQIAEYIEKSNNSYSYLAFLTPETRQKVVELQESLKQEVGDGLWLSNPETLHITLAEIIETRVDQTIQQQLFDTHATEYKKLPAKLLSGAKPIAVTFDTIQVSPQAIIIKGSDDGSFDKIREQFVRKIPFPDQTKSPPDIVHSTIARFTSEIDIEKVRQIASTHSFNFQEIVEEFMLVNNLKTPLEEYKILRTYKLRE